MLSSLMDLLIWGSVIFFGVFWWSTQNAKIYALRSAQKRCDEEGLQLLDQSVVFRKVKFRRDSYGRLRICRIFLFEFSSTGDERYRGHVETIGSRVTSIYLSPHRI